MHRGRPYQQRNEYPSEYADWKAAPPRSQRGPPPAWMSKEVAETSRACPPQRQQSDVRWGQPPALGPQSFQRSARAPHPGDTRRAPPVQPTQSRGVQPGYGADFDERFENVSDTGSDAIRRRKYNPEKQKYATSTLSSHRLPLQRWLHEEVTDGNLAVTVALQLVHLTFRRAIPSLHHLTVASALLLVGLDLRPWDGRVLATPTRILMQGTRHCRSLQLLEDSARLLLLLVQCRLLAMLQAGDRLSRHGPIS
eukprot:NODE_3454_length_973_cov_19.939394_g3172_i0.p1 GENE.NODE_3454_length_973_cov_19.939394_g3172_i0~~NODE_3454_length_973_cov_19.939394_g3172_i0.p1  ORF type:complete len:252 (+),score=9.05 NODE_3454_length_973_cov_19.939394_g3172_i0:36-791(+)